MKKQLLLFTLSFACIFVSPSKAFIGLGSATVPDVGFFMTELQATGGMQTPLLGQIGSCEFTYMEGPPLGKTLEQTRKEWMDETWKKVGD